MLNESTSPMKAHWAARKEAAMRSLHFAILLGLLFATSCWSQTEADTLVKVGDAAPGFALTTTDGAVVSTEQSKGKVMLVNFFATWCGPCMAEMPHLESEVWQKFKDQGL